MSSDREIMQVYLTDIASQNRQVMNRRVGREMMMEGLNGYGVKFHRLYEGIMSADDEKMLSRIAYSDRLV